MKYEEYLELRKRRDWLQSQEDWHRVRDGNWHRNQANYYRRIGRKVSRDISFTDVMNHTMRFHTPKIIANVCTTNALLNAILGR